MQLGAIGSIDGTRALQIAEAYLAAFFDEMIRGVPHPPLPGPSTAYPEVAAVSINRF